MKDWRADHPAKQLRDLTDRDCKECAMDSTRKKRVTILLGVFLAAGLIIAILYGRQRLFTKTEPIVLTA